MKNEYQILIMRLIKDWYKNNCRLNQLKDIIKLISLTLENHIDLDNKNMSDPRMQHILAIDVVYSYLLKKNRTRFLDKQIINDTYFNLNSALRKLTNFFNSINAIAKEYIKIRDYNICKICGGGDNIEIDHIIPKSHIGISHPWNLQCLCQKCNENKSNIILDEFVDMINIAKINSKKIFEHKRVDNIYYLLSLYYKTPKIKQNEIENFLNNIISIQPKKYPNFDDITDFLSNDK